MTLDASNTVSQAGRSSPRSMPEFGAPSTGWGATMDAADILTTAAEALRNFERHLEAMRVARGRVHFGALNQRVALAYALQPPGIWLRT